MEIKGKKILLTGATGAESRRRRFIPSHRVLRSAITKRPAVELIGPCQNRGRGRSLTPADPGLLFSPRMSSPPPPSLLYCHCQYAQVVPRETKDAVLRGLCESGVAFEAVADLCEMAARRDPALARLAATGAVKVAACFPRAVKGLFHQAGADLPLTGAEVLNMRTQPPEEVLAGLLAAELHPNLPTGKETAPVAALVREPAVA